MKKEDFERLKAKLGDEFTAEYRVRKDKVMVLVTKKDHWKGLEFVECIEQTKYLEIGKIYKILERNGTNRDIAFKLFSIGENDLWVSLFNKQIIKPSTEQAYVEQLKKTAFEKFGEIKEGDKFVEPYLTDQFNVVGFSGHGWGYMKKHDILYFENIYLYQQGKWAERVKERVNVELKSAEIYHSTQFPKLEFEFNSSFKVEKSKSNELGKFLASKLEKYLNGEIE